VDKLSKGKTIVDSTQFRYIIERLAHQLIENHGDFSQSIIIGVQPRGIELCDKIHTIIERKLNKPIQKGTLDISMHRDDIHLQDKPMAMNQTEIPISLDDVNIILIDDVLYTGRTIRAALDTLMDFGRPRDIELLVLIDRRLHRNVPIQAKYIGKSIDSIQREKVKVNLSSDDDHNSVEIFTQI
jgi:pyrimidine operon attenuation protein / uracil phosphoribosyltransferase